MKKIFLSVLFFPLYATVIVCSSRSFAQKPIRYTLSDSQGSELAVITFRYSVDGYTASLLNWSVMFKVSKNPEGVCEVNLNLDSLLYTAHLPTCNYYDVLVGQTRESPLTLGKGEKTGSGKLLLTNRGGLPNARQFTEVISFDGREISRTTMTLNERNEIETADATVDGRIFRLRRIQSLVSRQTLRK